MWVKKHVWQEDHIWNSATCSCWNEKYLASIMDSVITCDKAIASYDEEIKTIPYSNKVFKKIWLVKHKISVLLAYLLIAITLWIAVSIYCYLIKCLAKEKHLLPFHDTKLKEVCINNINWKWAIKSKI